MAPSRALTLAIVVLAASLGYAQDLPTVGDGLRLKREQRLTQAAEVFRAVLAREPQNYDALVQLATVEGWQQHYPDSLILWREARRRKPHDADAGVGLARVAYWSGDLALAEKTLRDVIAEVPEYPDALVLMGDLQMAADHPAEARRFYRRAEAADVNTPDIKTKLAHAIAPLNWRLDTGLIEEHFTGVRGNEQAVFEQLGYRASRRVNLWLRHDYENRFHQIDNTIGVGTSVVAAKGFVVSSEVFLTPSAGFEPPWRLHLNADYAAHPRLALTMDYRHSNYREGDLDIYSPGFSAVLSPRLTANLKFNVSHNTDRSITHSFQLRTDFQAVRDAQFYLGYARGTEDIPPQSSAFLMVYSAGAIWNVNRRLGVRLDYSYEHRRNFYNHQSVGPGVRFSF